MAMSNTRAIGGFLADREAEKQRAFLETIECMIYVTEHTALPGISNTAFQTLRQRVLALQDNLKMQLKEMVRAGTAELIHIVLKCDTNLNTLCENYRGIILPLSRARTQGRAEELRGLLHNRQEAKDQPVERQPVVIQALPQRPEQQTQLNLPVVILGDPTLLDNSPDEKKTASVVAFYSTKVPGGPSVNSVPSSDFKKTL